MTALSPDTHPEIERLQLERLRRMPAWRKVALVAEMSQTVRTLFTWRRPSRWTFLSSSRVRSTAPSWPGANEPNAHLCHRLGG